MPTSLLLNCPPLAKGHDMTRLHPTAIDGSRSSAAGRRLSPRAGILLICGGLFLIVSLAAAPAAPDSQNIPREKGNNPMQQAAMVSGKDIPPLDKSQPGRVETFTFGLG